MKLTYAVSAVSALLFQATDLVVAQEFPAYTAWWVVFNNPDACVSSPDQETKCGEVDVFGQAFLTSVSEGSPNPALIAPNAAAGIGVIYATGAVAEPDGKLFLSASIYRTTGEPLELEGGMDPLQLGNAWYNVDAEIHLVMRTHGAANEEGYIAQVTNFLEPYCDDPNLLFEGENNLNGNVCKDVQAVLSAPGESGEFPVNAMDTGSPIAGARAFVYRRGDAIQATVETVVPVPEVTTSPIRNNLPTKAYTMWFVVFNNPSECITSPDQAAKCGAVDVFGQAFLDSVGSGSPNPSLLAPNTAAGVGVVYASGGLTKEDGKLYLAASIYRTALAPLSLEPGMDPMGLGVAWTNVDAEVHLVMRSHGLAVGDDGYLAQLSNFLEPYCDDPNLLYEGESASGNICQDVQDVVSAPGVSGEFAVNTMATGVPIDGARAFIYRRGDGIQAVVETISSDPPAPTDSPLPTPEPGTPEPPASTANPTPSPSLRPTAASTPEPATSSAINKSQLSFVFVSMAAMLFSL